MISNDEAITRATRRVVGIAVLRRLRRIVDEDQTQARQQERWALRLVVIFLAMAGVFLAWLIQRVA